MRNLTIGDLRLALRDMLGDKLALLRQSITGGLYETPLRSKQRAIEELPEPADPRAPLVAELAEADRRHDALGAAIFYYCQGLEAHPDAAPGPRDTARRVRETFVPRLEVLTVSYADEAAAALDARGKLGEFSAGPTDARALAVPGGGTLYDWVTAFLDAGDEIDRLLRQRAATLATAGSAAAAGPLRGATLGLLGRFRDALRDEMEGEGSALLADYDARLFAYIDKLAANRSRADSARSAGGEGDGGGGGEGDGGGGGEGDGGGGGEGPDAGESAEPAEPAEPAAG